MSDRRPPRRRLAASSTISALSAALVLVWAGSQTGCAAGSGSGGGLLNPGAAREEVRQERAEQRVEIAERLVEQGRLDAALAEFGLALEDNPELIEAHLGMGNIYRQRGQNDIALRLFQQALDTDSTDNEKRADAYYGIGITSQVLGQVNDAIRAYLQALVLDPTATEANRDLGTAYVQAGRPDYAIAYAKKATELNPDDQAAWCNLAAVYNLLGEYDEALRSYRLATELGPLDDPVLLGLADTHLKLGNFQRAANTLESVIRMRPTSTAYERLGYAEFKRRDFRIALQHYRKAVELNPRETAAHNGIGAVLVTYYIQGERKNRGQLEDALNAWRTSLRIRPQQPQIVNLLGRYQRPG
ncbi:MAG: tetratricopeptide repeat protein [Planctomycetota bacterium]